MSPGGDALLTFMAPEMVVLLVSEQTAVTDVASGSAGVFIQRRAQLAKVALPERGAARVPAGALS